MVVYNFEELSPGYILPYLRTCPELVSLMKLIGNRFNSIQAVLLALLECYDISNCKGRLLDFAGDEVGASREEASIDNYFTVNLYHLNAEKHFYFSDSGISPYSNLSLEDSEYMQKIFAYICKNTTFPTFDEVIYCTKLITNADRVLISDGSFGLIIHLFGENIFFTSKGLKLLREILCEGIYIEEIKINE